jgi:hypothetical protein
VNAPREKESCFLGIFFLAFLLDYCSLECIVLIYCFYCPDLFGCIALGYNLGTVSVYDSDGLMFLVYSGVVLFHWFYCSESREESHFFFLDYCSRECIVLVYCFCCSGLFGCVALGYNSATVLVYASGGLMFSVYSGVVSLPWFYCSGYSSLLFWFIWTIVSVSSSGLIRILFCFFFGNC